MGVAALIKELSLPVPPRNYLKRHGGGSLRVLRLAMEPEGGMKGQDCSNDEEWKRDDRPGPRSDRITQKTEADHGYRTRGPRQAHDDPRAYTLAIRQDLLREHDDWRA